MAALGETSKRACMDFCQGRPTGGRRDGPGELPPLGKSLAGVSVARYRTSGRTGTPAPTSTPGTPVPTPTPGSHLSAARLSARTSALPRSRTPTLRVEAPRAPGGHVPVSLRHVCRSCPPEGAESDVPSVIGRSRDATPPWKWRVWRWLGFVVCGAFSVGRTTGGRNVTQGASGGCATPYNDRETVGPSPVGRARESTGIGVPVSVCPVVRSHSGPGEFSTGPGWRAVSVGAKT